jgi:hypothetical protein
MKAYLGNRGREVNNNNKQQLEEGRGKKFTQDSYLKEQQQESESP